MLIIRVAEEPATAKWARKTKLQIFLYVNVLKKNILNKINNSLWASCKIFGRQKQKS